MASDSFWGFTNSSQWETLYRKNTDNQLQLTSLCCSTCRGRQKTAGGRKTCRTNRNLQGGTKTCCALLWEVTAMTHYMNNNSLSVVTAPSGGTWLWHDWILSKTQSGFWTFSCCSKAFNEFERCFMFSFLSGETSVHTFIYSSFRWKRFFHSDWLLPLIFRFSLKIKKIKGATVNLHANAACFRW